MSGFGLLPITFRFRGKVRPLFEIYHCFLTRPREALHPTQIARNARLPFATVARLLSDTPEMFIRLPKRDGLTRYRLATAMAARQPEAVESYLAAAARRESLILYAVLTIVVGALLIVAALVTQEIRLTASAATQGEAISAGRVEPGPFEQRPAVATRLFFRHQQRDERILPATAQQLHRHPASGRQFRGDFTEACDIGNRCLRQCNDDVAAADAGIPGGAA